MWEELVLRELERERREALDASSAHAWVMTAPSFRRRRGFREMLGFGVRPLLRALLVSRVPVPHR
jgi:hypothetical protein